MTGVVIVWFRDRGYGKVRAGRQNLFVHREDLIDVVDLVPGQRVEFEPADTPKGPRALDVALSPTR
jgi:cold shock CspA family protein